MYVGQVCFALRAGPSPLYNNTMIQIFTDGGSRGNPGPSALGVSIQKDGKILTAFGKTLGVTTNNIAEYSAAVSALGWIVSHKDELEEKEEIFFYADSELLISQITGIYRIKNANLRELLFTLRSLEAQIERPIHYRHIPREQNKAADRQVNIALDGQSS